MADLKDQAMGFTQGLEDTATFGMSPYLYAAVLAKAQDMPFEDALEVVERVRAEQSERTPAASMIGSMVPMPGQAGKPFVSTFERIGKNPNVIKMPVKSVSDNMKNAANYLLKKGKANFPELKKMFGLSDKETDQLQITERTTGGNVNLKRAMRGMGKKENEAPHKSILEEAERWTQGIEAFPEVKGTYTRVQDTPDARTGFMDDYIGLKVGDLMETTTHEPFSGPGGSYPAAGVNKNKGTRVLIEYEGTAKDISTLGKYQHEKEYQVPQGTRGRVHSISDEYEDPVYGWVRKIKIKQEPVENAQPSAPQGRFYNYENPDIPQDPAPEQFLGIKNILK